MSAPIRVALLGCGNVGAQVVRLLTEQADDLAARVGAPIELAGIAVRRPNRHPEIPAGAAVSRSTDPSLRTRYYLLPGTIWTGCGHNTKSLVAVSVMRVELKPS